MSGFRPQPLDDIDEDIDDPDNSNKSIAVIVQTCDKYSWMWKPWNFYFKRTLPYDYIFYVQDDFWPIQDSPQQLFHSVLGMMEDHKLDFLRLFNANEMHSITVGRVVAEPAELSVAGMPLWRLHPESPFLLSHQPTIWRRDLLLECM
eukprot:gene26831-32980_t